MISYQILTIWWSIFHEKRPQRCFIINTLNSFFNWRSCTNAWEQRNVTTAAEKLLARMAFVIFIVTKWILIKKNSRKAWRRSLQTTQQIFQGSWRYAFDALPQHQILQTNSSMFFLWRNLLLNDSKLIKKLKFLSKKLTICRFRCMWCDQ